MKKNDIIFWNDPDQGLASDAHKIHSLDIENGTAMLDGGNTEVLISEIQTASDLESEIFEFISIETDNEFGGEFTRTDYESDGKRVFSAFVTLERLNDVRREVRKLRKIAEHVS